MLTIIIWLLMAIACGMIAQSKNRSVALWIVLGFLFGIITLIIIAVLPHNKER